MLCLKFLLADVVVVPFEFRLHKLLLVTCISQPTASLWQFSTCPAGGSQP